MPGSAAPGLRQALVVDDSRFIRRLNGSLLRRCGFEVTEAGGGAEALAALDELAEPVLVLLDWNLPDLAGKELLDAIRHRSARGSRIVVVSSETGPEAIRDGLAHGADDWLLKPFDEEALRTRLDRLGLPA